MITPKQLQIIRACVGYALEELGPHCPNAFRDYLPTEMVLQEELKDLLDQLKQSELRYLPLRSAINMIEFKQATQLAATEPMATLLLPMST